MLYSSDHRGGMSVVRLTKAASGGSVRSKTLFDCSTQFQPPEVPHLRINKKWSCLVITDAFTIIISYFFLGLKETLCSKKSWIQWATLQNGCMIAKFGYHVILSPRQMKAPDQLSSSRLALNGIKKTQMSYTVYLLAPSLSENHSRDGVLRQTLVFHNAPTTSIP